METVAENRAHFEDLDRGDDLRRFRGEFELPDGVVYLDGNSLGALPRRVKACLARVVEVEWGRGLIGSWDGADWISLPQRTGDLIARLIGAEAGEVIAADSTTVNLYKALSVAMRIDPARHVIVSEKSNFPTDLYVAQGLASQLGSECELLLVEPEEGAIERALAERGREVAALFLTHVHYTTSRMHDMRGLTAAAHKAGAVTVWDLSHSAGIMPVELGRCGADFAVGCGYKYLNGGPGAPAFLYVSKRHHDRMQPIPGWMGDARPFEFRPDYVPASGIARFQSGTPPVIGMAALEASVELILEAPMESIRRKSVALGDAFIALVDRHCAGLGLELVSPRAGAARGSHISYRHAASYPVMQALIARGVIGDCRPPDLLRFGFAPLYVRYADIWDAVMQFAEVLRSKAWDAPQYQSRRKVT
ncbi:MAG: kynureninase [Usitatibacter sp.]